MKNLVIERLRKRKKQYEVAADMGVTQTYICNLEKGKEIPSDDFAKKLEEYYERPIQYLLKEIE